MLKKNANHQSKKRKLIYQIKIQNLSLLQITLSLIDFSKYLKKNRLILDNFLVNITINVQKKTIDEKKTKKRKFLL